MCTDLHLRAHRHFRLKTTPVSVHLTSTSKNLYRKKSQNTPKRRAINGFTTWKVTTTSILYFKTNRTSLPTTNATGICATEASSSSTAIADSGLCGTCDKAMPTYCASRTHELWSMSVSVSGQTIGAGTSISTTFRACSSSMHTSTWHMEKYTCARTTCFGCSRTLRSTRTITATLFCSRAFRKQTRCGSGI